MATEIERKFLVASDAWRKAADEGVELRQGYISADPRHSVRVRIAGERATLTIKGAKEGAGRHEFEYDVPLSDARQMLAELCHKPFIEKRRHRLEIDGRLWEIDVFAGDNEGLVVAEIELANENEPFEIPPWLGREVTDDPRYYNANLFRHPYKRWQER